ncbi:MAG: SufD family Fe-S cluster assembly protein [Oscillospiraceae bacterium]|jgi:Fe-S cluster assembly scaffold protein SufB|nr:SufD family Fe-S cluster assembly protein [Oscillospiraceae bacterium]MDD3260848.1 SufD family Fe-S cluster assembly protein [Oscillospiraceae bacterium]
MEQQLKNINTLPALTWNWLDVNCASFLAQRPQQVKPVQMAPEFAEIETGMGAQAADFAAQYCTDCHVVDVPENTEDKEEKTFQYVLSAEKPVVDVNLIHARKGSKVTVLESYTAGDDTPCFHGGLTKILADEGAQVRLVQVQLLSGNSRHFNDVGIKLGDNAHVEVVQAELGAARAFSGCLVLLAGYRSSFNADTVYFGDEKRKLDLNYIARHTGRKTNSEMHAAGALLGQSDKVYRGTIDFIRGAAGSVGHEAEETLLFSPQARNRTVPLILCSEENVDGQHAATIGRINEARLFYLKSRGLTEAQAKQLIIEAQFAPVIGKVSDTALQAAVKDYLGRRMQLD